MTHYVSPAPAGLFLPNALLDALETGFILLAPGYAPHDPTTLLTLSYVAANSVAQRLLALPSQPTGLFGTAGPQETLLFAFCRATFWAGEVGYFAPDYAAADGSRWRVVAQRHGEQLLVSFMATREAAATQHHTAPEQVPARAPHAGYQQEWQHLFEQAPVAIAMLRGPQHVLVQANAASWALLDCPSNQALNRPLFASLPARGNQCLRQHLDEVLATGETHQAHALPTLLDRAGRPEMVYLDVVFQPIYGPYDHLDGVTLMATDVSAQVAAHQQVQELNAELQAANEELRANNEELAHAQGQLQLLNHELAARVAAGIDEAQRARAEAERQRERLERFFAQAPAAVCVLSGPELVFELVNPSFQKLFPSRPLLGLPVLEALPEFRDMSLWEQMQRVYATGETNEETSRLIPLAQYTGGPLTDFYFHYVQQARYNAQGHIDGVLVFALDITAQVRVQQRAEHLQEQMLAAVHRRAQEREAGLTQLHTIFEQAPVGLAQLTGPDYVVEVANPAICGMWGREQQRVLNQPLFAVLPEVVDQGIPELLAEVRRTGQSFVAEERPVQLWRRGRLETVYFQFVYQPLTDAVGQVAAIVIVATDVSARLLNRQQLARANEELRTTNAQLTHTNTDLDTFIYTASHDLKAPIANIESLLLLLRKQLPAAAQQVGLVPRVLGMMQESVERFQLTIAQLTDLSRLQEVRATPAQAVELAAVVEAVRLDLAPLLEAAGAQLVVDTTACATVELAPQHLRSVVYNLLSNAVKYRHPDRVPEVQLRCYPAAQATVLEVQDNGLGLSKHQQGKLFTLFQRLHTHTEGSGVGLYMVKRIVENAGGTITVRSELGAGSTFTVTFPVESPIALP